ncbi:MULTISPECIES: NAD-glutamate dehydrogenase [unclassified Psychrobacter]|uniref:NAD-glutamate dehydrogenase n=1 Tax=unclassified Psychrobacter TaxID=196806 RepID=UPI000EE3F3E2|nr:MULTISPECIES: NAD-glutamate dehydrogenase [unclassified Psychrobacter]HCI77074.1 NAD-glutamate dehydrogenase [Psychrobacter sp.]
MPNSLSIAKERISQISDIATSYVQKDKSLFDHFIHSYYQPLHAEAAETISNADLAGMALHHFTLLQAYDGSKPQLKVLNPKAEEQHFHSSHTVIQIVAYDRPFLVDTILMSLEAEGIDVHRTYNIIVSVERDDNGHITHIEGAHESATSHLSLIHCEIAYQNDEDLAALQQMLLAKIDTLDTVVGDWKQMRAQLTDIKAELSKKPLPEVFYSQQEIQAFLDWILDDHFIFLGYREYRLEGGQAVEVNSEPADLDLFAIGNSGLGLLRGAEEDKLSESFSQLPKVLKQLLTEPRVLMLSKSSRVSPVHRPVYMDFLGIHKFDDNGKLVGEYRFIGLLTSQAYQLTVQQIPLLREKANKIMAMAELPRDGHAHHKMMHVINTLPRDDLFQASVEELYPIVSGISQLQDKKSLRLFSRIDHYQRFVSCLVYIPRDKFNTELRIKVQNVLKEAYGGTSSGFTTEFNESAHARVHVHVRTVPGQVKDVNTAELEAKLAALMQSWSDSYQKMLLDNVGEQQANALNRRFLNYIPAAYQERFDARTAVEDTKRLAVLTAEQPMIWHLYQSTGDASNQLHLKLYGREQPVILSKVLPILENFGVSVISAQTYEFDLPEQPIWMQEYELTLEHVDTVNMQVVRGQFEDSLKQIWAGHVESDSFNELVLTTNLDTYDVVVLRALSRYMMQAKAPFSSTYIQQTVVKNSDISVALGCLFDARMNPKYSADERTEKTAQIQQQITAALTDVDSLDEDRILRWYLDLINAMVRTNFYQTDSNGQRKDRLSFKFLAADIPNLPKPKPMFEIFVYSPRVEAVHLRGGKVARGGLRWSDRMEDFRTEVLGLVKAQMVKNAVIVPVGSKGGFIVKTKTMADGRDEFQAEGIACYQAFLRGMLDVTDNIVDGKIVPPANTVRHDEDDPYLVVAADKGTASFSDIANALSTEYDFWLDDAFASGGSVGYDHKAMGITARGGWESVKRHFRMRGMDIQNHDNFTVVGIGDMSGDVFGNGMLLSTHTQLVAAFNHLHIFIDPNPDAATSYAERARLFDMPRSTWDDYEKSLISQGGGVFSRQDKSITLSAEMKQRFDIAADSLAPNELISALLKSPVDLIWNGGIGTYVKSVNESHADVGDRANDAVRVNGNELRTAIVGEGGNLGFTQQGRIEYAQTGGRIYTDAIDNSGGVNCSDHEVNIKILLGKVVEQGDMTLKQRNELLESMTDNVAELVLRQNYLQPQAIELSHIRAAANLSDHQRFIQMLEGEGRLDRAIEYLPSDEEIAKRQKSDTGLTNPELAVVMAYGKMWVYDNLLSSDLPDDAYFINELRKYFPDELATRFFDEMTEHRLHREIISTYLTNSVVNRLGIEALFRLYEETDQSLATIVRGYAISRDVFNVSKAWKTLEALDNQVDAKLLLNLELRLRDALEHGVVWFINAFGQDLQVADMISRFSDSVEKLTKSGGFIEQQFAEYLQEDTTSLMQNDLSNSDAALFAMLPYHVDALDAALLAEQYERPVDEIATLYFDAYHVLQLDWMMDNIATLPQQDYWDRRARHALMNELSRSLRLLMDAILSKPDAKQAFGEWRSRHLDHLESVTTEMSKLDQLYANDADSKISLSTLSVLMSELSGLVTK